MIDYINNMMADMPRNQLVTLIVCLVIFIVVALYYLYKCIRSTEVEYFEEATEEEETENFANNDVVVRMFHVKWCGYCKRAKPDFMKFMQQNDGKVINGRKVSIEMVDCEENKNNEALAKKFGVQGYPTFILTKDGKNNSYEGADRSPKGFLSWVKSLVN